MKQEKKLNHRNCTMKYHKTHDVQHLIDGVNVIARWKYDHIIHEVVSETKEKVRTGIRNLIKYLT